MANKQGQSEVKTNFYPHMMVKNNDHPNKLLAFPFLGFIIRILFILPVCFYYLYLTIIYLVYWTITPFVIVIKGTYWDRAYRFNVEYMKVSTKIALYMTGLTDKYPGFNRSDNGLFELSIDKPQAPSKLLGFPLLGFVIRIVLLIPYIIYASVLNQGAQFAYFFSWFAVLFKGKYPESLYEFVRDNIRVSNASTAYTSYMSDLYPSFKISMNHKKVKIFLIILGVLSMLANMAPEPDPDAYKDVPQNERMYDSTQDAADTFSDF